jgi:hypothetical protein
MLSQNATTGASSQSSKKGAAAGSAPGCANARTIPTTAAVSGLTLIWANARHNPWRPVSTDARAWVEAEVSHSSSRRRVTANRSRVTPMACRVFHAL